MIISDEILIRKHASMGKTEQIPEFFRRLTIGPPPPLATPAYFPQILIGPPAPMATPAVPVWAWNMAETGDDEAEIVLYGEIRSEQPIDWWTGEPMPGNYITPEGFLEDLEPIKSKGRITVRINSPGGDMYTAIAIHNALKGLSGHVTTIDESLAASGGSVILCAGDTTKAYPGSIVMIHGVSGLLYNYYNIPDLKKIIKGFEAGERALAEIYNAKTGIDLDKLHGMMTAEKWMTGKEAHELGFIDELIEGSDPQISVSADRKVMFINGTQHSLEGFTNVPVWLPVAKNNLQSAAAPRPTAGINPQIVKEGGKQTMTLEELKTKHPDLYSQIVTETQASATSAASATASAESAELLKSERKRIEAIDSIAAIVGDPDLVKEAKYGETPLTAEELALKAMQKQASLGVQHLADAAEDFQKSGAADVGAVPNGGKDDPKEADVAEAQALANSYMQIKTGGTVK